MQISLDEVSRLFRTQATQRQQSSRMSGTNRSFATGTSNPASSAEVSDRAQEVRRVLRKVNELPDREDRVEALKAQIENGTYKVSGEEIADLIIRRAFADGVR
jgi:negative regulator of flagellin synthesis FlgM